MPNIQSPDHSQKSSTLLPTSNKSLQRAGKLYLLMGEALKYPQEISQKMGYYIKAVELYTGINLNLTTSGPDFDIYNLALKCYPQLVKFFCKLLKEAIEPVQIACLRGLEFIMELVGCTMAQFFPEILKLLIQLYSEKREKGLMVGVLNHFFENYLNALTSASSLVLREIFHEILIHELFIETRNEQLRIYLFRITEKIISICQGDITLNTQFFSHMLLLLKNMNQSIRNASLKLWDTVKIRLITNFNDQQLNSLIEWICEMLYTLYQQESFVAYEMTLLYQLLDIISLICLKDNKNLSNSPFNTFKNAAANQKNNVILFDF